MQSSEADTYLSFREALAVVEAHTSPLQAVRIALGGASGHVLASDVLATVSSPPGDAAQKDGFAVIAADVVQASGERPVRLRLGSPAWAGHPAEGRVASGWAASVTTGAMLPPGADAVVPEELCAGEGEDSVAVCARVEPGDNVLPGGTDIHAGRTVGRAGDLLTPGLVGWLAAAGAGQVDVVPRPRVGLLSCGDELVAPGRPLGPGQLHASNLATLEAHLSGLGYPTLSTMVGDDTRAIAEAIDRLSPDVEALITIGGTRGSSRDLVLPVLERLGWRKLFHRVRMVPGKWVAFGTLYGRVVFCLPGGPAANEMTFLHLALPGLGRLSGRSGSPLPRLGARLAAPISGRHPGWTEHVPVELRRRGADLLAAPCRLASRLESIALAHAVVCLPEETDTLVAGTYVDALVLRWPEAWLPERSISADPLAELPP